MAYAALHDLVLAGRCRSPDRPGGSPRRCRICALTRSMAGDRLGDGVLDLDARVDLDEVVTAVLADQELDRAGVDVADVARDLERVVGQPCPQLLGRATRPARTRRPSGGGAAPSSRARRGGRGCRGCRRGSAPRCAWARRTSFSRKTSSRRRTPSAASRARALEQLGELAGAAHDAHAAAAAARRRLDHHRVADLVGEGARRLQRLDRRRASRAPSTPRPPRRSSAPPPCRPARRSPRASGRRRRSPPRGTCARTTARSERKP